MICKIQERLEKSKNDIDDIADDIHLVDQEISDVYRRLEDIIKKCDNGYYEEIHEVRDELSDIVKVLEDI